MAVDFDQAAIAIAFLLEALGADRADPNLKDTPNRVARMYQEFLDADPGNYATLFESEAIDQLVVVSDMRVYSLCAHHLLPFWCDVSIGYLAHNQVIGLSKLARIAHMHARRLQTQEHLVEQIASTVATILEHDDVAVLARGHHTCMEMRGVRTAGLMTSSAMRGAFRENATTRGEFLHLVTTGNGR